MLRIPRERTRPSPRLTRSPRPRPKAPAFVDHAAKVAASMGAPELATHAALALHVLFELGDPRSEGLRISPRFRASPKGVPVGAAAVDPDAGRDAAGHAHARARAAPGEVRQRRARGALPGGGGGVPLEKFAWALSSVLSRASSGDRMPYAFLPGVDLLNHGGVDTNCELSAVKLANEGERRKSMGRRRGYVRRRTSPRVNSSRFPYGDESDNCRLLRLYGFATRGNVHDKREIELRLTGDALDAWRSSRRWGPGIDAARRAILRLHGLPRLTGEFEHADAAGLDDGEVVGSNPGGAAVFRDPTLPRPETIDEKDEKDEESSRRRGVSGTEGEGEGTDDAVRWRCVVAHPSKPFPTVARAADSSTPAAHAAHDAATVLAATHGVPPSVLLASLRVHLLTGFEPAGPDGGEPDPRSPISERNEAAARAVLGESAERRASRDERRVETREWGLTTRLGLSWTSWTRIGRGRSRRS